MQLVVLLVVLKDDLLVDEKAEMWVVVWVVWLVAW